MLYNIYSQPRIRCVQTYTMNTVSIRRSVTATLLGLLLASTASAGLIGDTAGTRVYGSGGSSSFDTGVQNSVVGAGDEGILFGSQYYNYGDFDFAIRSTNTFLTGFANGGTVSLQLSSLDFPGLLTSVTFQTNLSGVSYVSNANMVTFTWNDQPINSGTYLTAQFNSSVPESGTTASLLGLSLFGLVAVRRKLS